MPDTVYVMLTDDRRHDVFPYVFTDRGEALKAAEAMRGNVFGYAIPAIPAVDTPPAWEVRYSNGRKAVWVVRRFVYDHASEM